MAESAPIQTTYLQVANDLAEGIEDLILLLECRDGGFEDRASDRRSRRAGEPILSRAKKSARSCALLTRGKIGGTARPRTRPASPRYAGNSEERKTVVRGAPGHAANPARISPGGQCRWRCSVAVAAIGTRPDE
jgi:hypothetical protein